MLFRTCYLEVLCNFTDKALEGQLADQKFSALLVLANFTTKKNMEKDQYM